MMNRKQFMRVQWLFIAIFIPFLSFSQLNGLYTIDQTSLLSSTNFHSVDSAFQMLSDSGINGPVTLSMVANSGPYHEKAVLDSVPGSSAVNTITLLGNGNTMQDSGTLLSRHVIQIRGVDYVTIDSLTIKCLGPEFGSGVHFLNSADHNTIKNCTFDMAGLINSSSVSSIAIAFSEDTANLNSSGNSGSYCTIENNVLIAGNSGVQYGIQILGSSTHTLTGHVIKNNILKGFDLRGISIRYCDSTLIQGNDISRPQSVSVGSFTGIELVNLCENVRIENNRIHNTNGAGINTTAYGIVISYCDASTGNENIIANNLLYNFNGNGSAYPLFSNNSSGNHFYYNTVSLDHVNATSGNTRGFYQNGAESNIIFKNNIISVTRGGSGDKYCIYMTSTFNSVDSDYNILYINAPGTGAQHVGRWSTDHTTLSNWQSANSSSYDQNSIAVNPAFQDLDSMIIPANGAANNAGTPIAGIGLDYFGITRNATTPDAGAIEFSSDSLDASVHNIIGLENICPSVSPVSVEVMNLGDSNLTSLTINWRLNGVLQTPVSYNDTLNAGQVDTVLLGSVTVAAGINYTIEAWTSSPNGGADGNTANDTLIVTDRGAGLSGTYSIGIFGDYPTPRAAVEALNERGMCGAVIFNVDSASGPFEGRLYLIDIPGNNATNTITFNGNGAEVSYETNSSFPGVFFLQSVDYCTIYNFHIIAKGINDAMGVYISDSSDHNTITNCEIEIWSTNTFQISAGIHISSSGSYYTDGYNANFTTINGNWIHAGSSSLSGPSYGIKLLGGSNGLDAQNNSIVNNKIDDFHFAGIYATEQQNLLIQSNEISRPNRSNSFSGVYGIHLSDTSQNCDIKRNEIHDFFQSSTSSSSIGIYVDKVDANTGSETIVANNLIYNINNGSNGMTGISNFGADGCFIYFNTIYADNSSGPASSMYGISQSLTASNVSIQNNLIYLKSGSFGTLYGLRYSSNSSSISSNYNNVFLSSTGATRRYGVWGSTQYTTLANWKTANSGAFDANSLDLDPSFTNPSIENFAPTSLSLNNSGTPLSGISVDFYSSIRNASAPDIGAIEFPRTLHDIGVFEITGVENPCPGNVSVMATVINYGSNSVNPFTVNWTINGVTQATVLDTNTLASGDTAVVLLGTIAMNATTVYDIISWTTDPNNQIDPTNSNDTAKILGKETSFAGNISVGSAGDFSTFQAAVSALNSRGMCGPVTLNIDPISGPYVGRTILGPINGNSAINTITINGNGAVVSAPTSFSFPYVFVMDGVNYTKVDSLTIVASGTSYGLGIILTNNAHHNSIENCTVDISNPSSTFSGATAGIVASASITGATQGDNANYTIIKNNTIKGGANGGPYRAISFLGSSQDTLRGIEILNNTIIDPYRSGILLVFCEGAIVSGNDVSRPNMINPTTFYGLNVGAGNTNCIIEKNQLHNTFGNSTSLLSSYGIYYSSWAPVGEENYVYNNLYYDVNGGGRAFGVYTSSGTGLKVYNNTFSFDDTTTAASHLWNTGGIFISQFADSITFENNIVSITRKGDSDAFGIYAEADPYLISNRNVLYIDGEADNYIAHYDGIDYESLSSWTSAYGGSFDQQSIDLNPEYQSISSDDYTPTNSIADGLASTVSGITEDLYEQSRSINLPDPGAIEFTSSSIYINDSCGSATPISFGLTVGSTINASSDNAPSCLTGSTNDGGVWYSILGNGNLYTASLCNATYDTRIRIYSGTCSNLICEIGNDDSCNTQSIASWCSQDAVEYFILVHGNGAEGHFFLELTESVLIPPLVSFVGSSSICEGDSVEIVSSTANSYLWNDPAMSTSQSIVIHDNSNYFVIVEDTFGCFAQSNTVFANVLPVPAVDLGNDTTLCLELNASLTLNGGVGSAYSWSNGASTPSITLTASDLGIGTHPISVDITGGNSCIGSDEIIVNVTECFVGLTGLQSERIKCYPNPVHDMLNIIMPATVHSISLQLIDIQGKVVYNYNGQLVEGLNEFDLSTIESGMYLLTILGEQITLREKIQVQ